MAYLYNMSLEQYYEKLLGITKQEFYEKCLNEGEKQIKKYLIIGAVAKKEDIVITNDEWESEKIDTKKYRMPESSFISRDVLVTIRALMPDINKLLFSSTPVEVTARSGEDEEKAAEGIKTFFMTSK